jgi:cytochrome c2
MNRSIRLALTAAAIAALAILPALATDELAEKERVRCRACHVKSGSKLLSDKGKYYEHKRSFEGYDQILRKFKKCTVCHVKEPGSAELTHSGMELKNRDVTMDHLSAPDPTHKKRKRE